MVEAGMSRCSVRAGVVAGALALASASHAQIPDLLSSFDSGSRSSGAGGMLNAVGSEANSIAYNPAALGYVSARLANASYRNLPKSRTRASGEIADVNRKSDGLSGKGALTNLAVAVPVARGVVGISYQVAGYIDDLERGSVSEGGDPLEKYDVRLKAQTDLYTIGYGRASSDQLSSYGIGLVFAEHSTRSKQLIGHTDALLIDQNVRERGNGIGVILGGEWIPKHMPNMTFGASYRSEIKLNYGSGKAKLYEAIPARLAFSAAVRQDGFRGGQDFLVYGLQAQYHFPAKGTGKLDRDGQFVAGVGAEYSYKYGNYRVPLRVGYWAAQRGNSLLDSRSVFTFGIGLRPLNGNYTIDVNYGIPRGGGYDFAFTFGYRF